MKKSLSLVLAIALVFSMFSSMAFAADAKTPGQILFDAGVIKGDGTNLNEAGLWTRQDVAILLSRLYGAETEASTTAKAHPFGDVVNGKSTNYDGYISWAYNHEPQLMKGTSAVNFGFDRNLTAQEFAVVLLRVLGLDDTWETALELAQEEGLMSADFENGDLVTRGETFEGIVTTLNTEVEDGVTLGAKLKLKGFEPEVVLPALDGVKASGVKKVTAKFSTAVDKSKAAFTLRKGNVAVNFSTTWNDAATEATLTTSVNLSVGDYTLTVSGLELEGAASANFTVAPERIDSIVVTGNGYRSATTNTTVNTSFKIYNQYGEEITTAIDTNKLTIVSTVGNATIDGNAGKATGGITITNVPADKTSTVITVVDTQFAKTVRQEVTVLEAKQITKVVLTGTPKIKADKTQLEANVADYEIPYEAYDQYGNKVTLTADDEAKLTFVTSDASVIDLTQNNTIQIDGEGKLTVDFLAFNGPKEVSLTVIVNATGENSKITFTVYGASTPHTPELVAPSVRVGAGQTNFAVQLKVRDQYGNYMSTDAIIAARAQYTVTSGNSAVFTISDVANVDGNAAVRINAVAEGTANLTVTVNATGQSVTLPITVVEAKYPSSLTLSPNVYKAVAGATITLKGVFKDQYGDAITSSGNSVEVILENGNFTGQVTTDVTTLADPGVVLTAVNANSSTKVTVKLYNGGVAPANLVDTKEVTLTVVKADAALTYEVNAIGTVATAGAGNLASAYAKTVTVIGKEGSDSVALKPDVIQLVTSSDSTVLVAGQNGGAWKVVGTGTASVNAFANVTVAKPDGSTAVIAAPVAVSSAAPVATSIVAKSGNDVVSKATVGGAVANLFSSASTFYFVVTDQYGTTALSTPDNVSVFVTTPAGAINKINAVDGVLGYDFAAGAGKYKVNAVIGDKSVTIEVTR